MIAYLTGKNFYDIKRKEINNLHCKLITAVQVTFSYITQFSLMAHKTFKLSTKYIGITNVGFVEFYKNILLEFASP